MSEKHLDIKEKDVVTLTSRLYEKLPYNYFGDYLPENLLFLSRLAFPGQYMFNILYYKRSRYLPSLLSWKDVGIKIFLAALLLLYAVEDKKLIEESCKYIKTFSPVKSKNWEDLRKSLLYGFDRYFSQKII